MSHQWDEFSKSLAEPLPRRESLRHLGIVVAGAVLSPLGLATAFAGRSDPCKAFCQCRDRRQQDQCLKACRACNKDTSRVCGSCGNYVCCGSGRTCCSGYCTALADDVLNCGACGFVCDPPGPYEYGACIDGACTYVCADGAADCDGTCTFLDWDPDNCGACGNVCPDGAPFCNQGTCRECSPGLVLCGNSCVDLNSDPDNCGACGNVCGGSTPYCSQGACHGCIFPFILCGGVCVDPTSDPYNCGGCFQQCAPSEVCAGGFCQGFGGDGGF